jgi:hypothetical protein
MIFLSVVRPKGGPPAAWQGPVEKFPEPKTAKFNALGNYRKDVALTKEPLQNSHHRLVEIPLLL